MYDLAVCIPTFKRPDFLKKTISSITQSNLEGTDIRQINIIVVDNDAERTAELVVGHLMEEIPERYHLQYSNFPQKGLSNVRNKLLEKALQLHPKFVVFIDDDEYASEDWLKELVSAIIRNNSDIVVGRVVSVFEHEVPDYTAYWFEKGNHPNDSPIKKISSANMIISTEFLSRSGLKFDKRFNSTGAEDTYFGIQAGYEGARIYWAQNAVVFETVTKQRAKLNWLLRRRFRGAITFIYILGLEKKYFLIIKKIAISLLYLFMGIAGTVLMLFPVKLRYWGVLKVAEGFGGLAGAVNVKYHEYK